MSLPGRGYCKACVHVNVGCLATPCGQCYEGFLFEASGPAHTKDLESQLAEADRRAGAAERMLESEKDTTFRHRQWTREAKEAWGTDDRESFDKVWEEALGLKHKFEEAVASEVTSRTKSLLSYASMGIPLAKDTLGRVSRDEDAPPELRSDAIRAIDGLVRIETMASHVSKGPSPA